LVDSLDLAQATFVSQVRSFPTLSTKEIVMTTQQGGKGNFANDPQRASEAGKKGGERSHSGAQHEQSSEGGRSQQGGGNFADDPKRASEAGKKGGEHSGKSGQHEQGSQAGRSQHGGGNFADDPQKASDAGRKGGQS
jgi:general stress protein YciG